MYVTVAIEVFDIYNVLNSFKPQVRTDTILTKIAFTGYQAAWEATLTW